MDPKDHRMTVNAVEREYDAHVKSAEALSRTFKGSAEELEERTKELLEEAVEAKNKALTAAAEEAKQTELGVSALPESSH
jgi:hypothetical protein